MKTKKETVIEADPKILEWIGKIKTFEGDIKRFTANIKTIDEQIQEKIENTNEYLSVVEAEAVLHEARAKLKAVLSGDGEYNDLLEKRADENEVLKSAKQSMSDFILGYYHETGERQIETGVNNGRELVLSGRLGKEKKFQTSLFGVKTGD